MTTPTGTTPRAAQAGIPPFHPDAALAALPDMAAQDVSVRTGPPHQKPMADSRPRANSGGGGEDEACCCAKICCCCSCSNCCDCDC